MALAQRKNIRLKDYSYSQAGEYFITICAKDKRCLFGHVAEAESLGSAPYTVLSLVGQSVKKHILTMEKITGLSLERYIIMPNHIHLLLHIHGSDQKDIRCDEIIPRAVAMLKRLSNADAGENVFQRSYYDHIIRDEADHLKIVDYIDNNPARWNKDKLNPQCNIQKAPMSVNDSAM